MPKSKMPISQRAKIFMPFDALKGFKDALKEKEKIKVLKKELSDDQKEELNSKIREIIKGDMLTIVYYCQKDKTYLNVTGILTEINETMRYLKIVKNKIALDDILSIKKLNENIFE